MDENQALGRLRDILAQPAYQVDRSQPWWQPFLQPVSDLVRYLVARFLQTLADTRTGQAGWLGLIVLTMCAVLIGAVLVYLVRAVRLSVSRENQVRTSTLQARRERSERLWQTAQQLAAAGQFGEAVRNVYLSALYALDERALLHVETSLTNREHARQLSQVHPELGQTFGQIVERYDRVRYGRQAATERTFAELSGLVERARDAALQGSAA